jgi:hypothetical protein
LWERDNTITIIIAFRIAQFLWLSLAGRTQPSSPQMQQGRGCAPVHNARTESGSVDRCA